MNQAIPTFQVDPFWPKPLPNDWVVGQCSGVHVDDNDHVWLIHRRNSITNIEGGAVQNPKISEFGVPAPSILEFDAEGNLLNAWGGAGTDQQRWAESEHGIFVDKAGNVWTGANGRDDQTVLKSRPDGTRLLTLGEWGQNGGSNHQTQLGQPADITVDDEANEVYLADGYGNRRIVVFDTTTGAYKRHWGAYGRPPEDGPLDPYDPDAAPLRTFRNPVHAVRIAGDGLVYVADRVGCRIQVFQKDGTYVKEGFVQPKTRGMGSAWDLELSADPGQAFLYVADGTNGKVWICDRNSLQVVGSVGRKGRWAGCFEWVHNVASDSRGNLYTTEVNTGKRIQKFVKQ
jgi:DNA-binding beta-propeller fold protein YncE